MRKQKKAGDVARSSAQDNQTDRQTDIQTDKHFYQALIRFFKQKKTNAGQKSAYRVRELGVADKLLMDQELSKLKLSEKNSD